MRFPISASATVLLASVSLSCDGTSTDPIQSCSIQPITIVDQTGAPLGASTPLVVGQTKSVAVQIHYTGSCPSSYLVATWFSNNPSTVSVTQTGPYTADVTGLAPAGSTGVSVNIPGIAASAVFTVVAGPFDHITIAPANPTLVVLGTPLLLNVEFRDVGGFLTTGPAGSVVWSTQGATATINSTSGLFTQVAPVSVGNTTVTATFTATSPPITKSASTTVTVVPPATPQITTLVITPGTALVAIGTPAAPFIAKVLDQNGNQMPGVHGVTWTSLNTNIATIGALTGTITGIAAGGPVTIRAIADGNQSVFGDAQVTITPAPVVPVRIAYAVAEQPSAASYTADPASQFNGMGGPITVTRSGTGQYTATIPGFGGAAGESRLPFVNAVNSSSVVCLAISWAMIGVADATVRVDCSGPGGALTDSKFTIFAIGQGGLPGRLAFASSVSVPFPTFGNTNTLGSASAWSSSGLSPQITRDLAPAGRFLLGLRLPFTPTPDVPVVQPAGATTARCSVSSWGPTQDIVCYPVGSAVFADAPFSGMFLDQGRAGKRFGAAHSSLASVTRNSAGGATTVSATGAGTWRVTFANLGRPAGGRETVLVTAHALFSAVHCNPSAWTTVGSDLLVDVACFTGAGAPLSIADFVVVVIE